MAQHIHNLLQIHEDLPLTIILRATHAKLVKGNAIANVRGHVARLDGAVKGVDGAGGGLVGVLLEVPLVLGA